MEIPFPREARWAIVQPGDTLLITLPSDAIRPGTDLDAMREALERSVPGVRVVLMVGPSTVTIVQDTPAPVPVPDAPQAGP